MNYKKRKKSHVREGVIYALCHSKRFSVYTTDYKKGVSHRDLLTPRPHEYHAFRELVHVKELGLAALSSVALVLCVNPA